MGNSSKNIYIVGGGVIGFASAYYLLERGHSVTLFERRSREASNCSTGNAGMVVPSHFVPLAAPGVIWQGIRWLFQPESPFGIRPHWDPDLIRWLWAFHRACTPKRVNAAKPVLRDLSLKSRELFVALSDSQGLDFGLVRRGLVMLCKTAEVLEHEGHLAEEARRLGVEAELLDAAALARLDPAIQMDVAGGVYFPKDCHLNPGRFRESLRDRVEAMGGEIHWETDVEGIRQGHDRVRALHLSTGEEMPVDGELLIASGVWSAELASALRTDLPLQPGKGYSMTLANPPANPSLCSILVEARLAVTPMGGQLRFGGTMEIGAEEEGINQRRLDGIVRSIPAYFPEFASSDFAEQPVWSGLRPCSPDGLPYIGRLKHYANVSVAAGHAMLGLSLAPVTGWLIAQVLSDVAPALDLKLLDPNRYDR